MDNQDDTLSVAVAICETEKKFQFPQKGIRRKRVKWEGPVPAIARVPPKGIHKKQLSVRQQIVGLILKNLLEGENKDSQNEEQSVEILPNFPQNLGSKKCATQSEAENRHSDNNEQTAVDVVGDGSIVADPDPGPKLSITTTPPGRTRMVLRERSSKAAQIPKVTKPRKMRRNQNSGQEAKVPGFQPNPFLLLGLGEFSRFHESEISDDQMKWAMDLPRPPGAPDYTEELFPFLHAYLNQPTDKFKKVQEEMARLIR